MTIRIKRKCNLFLIISTLFTNPSDVLFIPVFLIFMRMRKIKRHLRNGRKTKSVLVMENSQLVLSALLPETIAGRAQADIEEPEE